ncbi:MAG TPA: fluoride efflux transporter CrcB [Balneolaceae bacterium]|nr:fluoride efflux transporter CrcB [Balneolaceae bacterium]
MLKTLILVGSGGFLGSSLRYLLSRYIESNWLSSFPYGTFGVNVLGCLIIGLIYGLSIKNLASGEVRLLLATGFCGGFTTFSSFSYEFLSLMQDGQHWYAFLYCFGSLLAGLLAVWIGLTLIKML